jgi:hypothetical protein
MRLSEQLSEYESVKVFNRSLQNLSIYFSLRPGSLKILKNQRCMDIKYRFNFIVLQKIFISGPSPFYIRLINWLIPIVNSWIAAAHSVLSDSNR